ncbi:hypothetical protein HK405_000550 [Cladochytrium tenue]|nr:hypothetical protein HK405_000550 [Cladochytrium tenue]
MGPPPSEGRGPGSPGSPGSPTSLSALPSPGAVDFAVEQLRLAARTTPGPETPGESHCPIDGVATKGDATEPAPTLPPFTWPRAAAADALSEDALAELTCQLTSLLRLHARADGPDGCCEAPIGARPTAGLDASRYDLARTPPYPRRPEVDATQYAPRCTLQLPAPPAQPPRLSPPLPRQHYPYMKNLPPSIPAARPAQQQRGASPVVVDRFGFRRAGRAALTVASLPPPYHLPAAVPQCGFQSEATAAATYSKLEKRRRAAARRRHHTSGVQLQPTAIATAKAPPPSNDPLRLRQPRIGSAWFGSRVPPILDCSPDAAATQPWHPGSLSLSFLAAKGPPRRHWLGAVPKGLPSHGADPASSRSQQAHPPLPPLPLPPPHSGTSHPTS